MAVSSRQVTLRLHAAYSPGRVIDMWLVRLTVRSSLSGKEGEHIVRIPGSRVEDLLYNREFKWKHLEAMLERGTLLKVEVDYKGTNGW